MSLTVVSPQQWNTSLNPDQYVLGVDGQDYWVQNADKSYSITAPAANIIRFQVDSGDVWTAVDPSYKERSNIAGMTPYLNGTQINASFSFDVEPGAANTSRFFCMADFHAIQNDGLSAPFEMMLSGEKLVFAVNYGNVGGSSLFKALYTSPTDITRGVYQDVKVQMELQNGGTGALAVWLNGVQVVNYTGQMGASGETGVYFKEGIYRYASPETIAIDYANLHVSSGAATSTPTAPTSVADTYAAKAGAALVVDAAHGVLVNDTDNNGQTLKAALSSGPAHGSVTLNSDGSFTYTPTAGYAGADSFSYIASDSLSTGTATKVTLNVAAAAPATQAIAYAAHTGQALTADAAHGVLSADTDNNGLALTAALAQNGGPQHGTLALNADGSFTYTPTAGYAGSDSFTYIASDSLSSSAPTTVTLNVAASAPITLAESYAAHTGQTLTEDAAHGVLAGVSDPNGLTLTAALAQNGGPQHGALTLNADGSFTYTPAAGYAGTDSFTYVASDGLATGAATTVTLNVADPAPTANPDAYAVAGDVATSVTAANGVLANDVDNNGLPLTAALAPNGGAQHGTVVLNADGSFTYTPNQGYVGTDSFSYVASDSLSASAPPTTVSITVAPQNIIGGTGNDTYYVYNSADQVTVAAGTPNETIVADCNYVLPANVQHLVLNGSGLTGTVNAAGDTITSQGGANTLVGNGNNITFYVNNTGDHVVAQSGQTGDTVVSSVSYSMPNNVHALQMTGVGMTATANAAGGNYMSSVNGGDTLVGSAKGNDTFIVSHANDVVVVAPGAVNDAVDAYCSYSLPANVQNLIGEGKADITLVGNGLGNIIVANTGADTLTGGGGADTFKVAPGDKLETITDFSSVDRVDIRSFLSAGLHPTFTDFGTYSTISFSTGETIKLLGVHASSLHVSGHYVV